MKRILCLLLLAAPAWARDPSRSALKQRVDAVVRRPEFASAFWAVEVRSLETGAVLYALDAGKSMTPGSVHKLLPTAAVLDAIDPGERLRTTVETAAAMDGAGRVLGDVFLAGRGDPALSDRFTPGARPTAALEALADALKAAGVRRIEGRVVGHEGLFTGERRGAGWGWEDLVWWYGAEVSALSLNDGVADLRVVPGERVGDPVRVERSPVTAYYSVVSTATTSPPAPKHDLRLERPSGGNAIRLSGTMPLGFVPETLSVAVEDPARYAATVFAEVLASRGIEVAGGPATSQEALPSETRVLAAHASPPLLELLKVINKRSHNVWAEMLLRVLGTRVKGDGSFEGAQAAVMDFLGRLGVDARGFSIDDAAGLSRADLVTAHGLVDLLVAMHRHPRAEDFRATLAVAGVDGSLRNRFKGTPAEGLVRAKTGSVRQADSIAGYATTRAGARVAFAILLNHHTTDGRAATAALDAIVLALVRS